MLVVKSLVNSEEKEDKTMIIYNYRLLKESYLNGQAYGIEIERQDFKDGNLINIERDQIKKISSIEEKVNNLLDLIHRNKVSPIHIVDILGEYVDNYVTDFC